MKNQMIAALPMYDWPEVRARVDAEWAELRMRLKAAAVDAPATLVRRNADIPAVAEGAEDMGHLQPGDFDLHALWMHPDLLVAQTCWGPMEAGLAEHVVVVGQSSYDGIEGGQDESYSSAILMRRGAGRASAPVDGKALVPVDLLRKSRFAFNEKRSMSGYMAFSRDIEAEGSSMSVFADFIETGSHRASIKAVAEGRADACAVDCRSWQMAQQYEPAAAALEPVGWTARRTGLPYITSRQTPAEVVAILRDLLSRP